MKLNNKGGVSIATILIVVAVIAAGAGGTAYIANESGYIPSTSVPRAPSNLDAYPVQRNNNNENTETKIYVEDKTYRAEFDDFLRDINLDDFKYQVYESQESPVTILNTYKSDLISDGFVIIEYEGESLYGSTTYENIEVYYGAFLKGLTATFIASMSESDTTHILFVTGNALDFKELAEELDIEL